MSRYTRSPPPTRHYESESGLDTLSSPSQASSESSSPTDSLRSFGSASLCAVAGSPTATQSAMEVGKRRVFEIASETYIDDVAYELADLIEGSTQESLSILHTIQLLSDSGVKSVEYSRSIALIAEELYMQLIAFDEAVADVFKSELGQLVMSKLLESWKASTDLELGIPEAESDPSGPADAALLRVSVFFGDLYAISFVTPEMLIDCMRTVVQTCAKADHLVCMFAILSRANSYMGPKLPLDFYVDLCAHIQRSSSVMFGMEYGSVEEYFSLVQLIDELMSDALDIRNLRAKSCSIAYAHVVNPRYHPTKMTVDVSDHFGQMYDLHRGLTPVSSNTSDSSVSPSNPFSTAITVLESRIEKMSLTDSGSCNCSSEDSDCESLDNREHGGKTLDCISVLDLDFEEATPNFVKEGLHLSLNATVPTPLTTPLPVRA